MKTQKIIMAFFDILGTSKKIEQGDYLKVYEYYEQMIQLCKDTHTPIAVHNPLYRKRQLFSDLNEVMADLASFDTRYHIINYSLNHAFFSDTFLLWIRDDAFLMPLLSGFYERCCIVFCEALKRGIVLRGTISMGEAIMDNDNHIYLGSPLVEAAKSETRQTWVGISIGQSIVNSLQKIQPMDMSYLLPFKKHLKTENEPLLSDFVLDWYGWWSQQEEENAEDLLRKLNSDPMHSAYYDNSFQFIQAAKKRELIWNEYMISQDIIRLRDLCLMGEQIPDQLRKARCEGIDLLTSEQVRHCIENLLNVERIWFDDNNVTLFKQFLQQKISNGESLIEVDQYTD